MSWPHPAPWTPLFSSVPPPGCDTEFWQSNKTITFYFTQTFVFMFLFGISEQRLNFGNKQTLQRCGLGYGDQQPWKVVTPGPEQVRGGILQDLDCGRASSTRGVVLGRRKLPGSEHGFWGLNPAWTSYSWRRKWQPTPVFLPGKSHGRRNLVVHGAAESDTTKRVSVSGQATCLGYLICTLRIIILHTSQG